MVTARGNALYIFMYIRMKYTEKNGQKRPMNPSININLWQNCIITIIFIIIAIIIGVQCMNTFSFSLKMCAISEIWIGVCSIYRSMHCGIQLMIALLCVVFLSFDSLYTLQNKITSQNIGQQQSKCTLTMFSSGHNLYNPIICALLRILEPFALGKTPQSYKNIFIIGNSKEQ